MTIAQVVTVLRMLSVQRMNYVYVKQAIVEFLILGGNVNLIHVQMIPVDHLPIVNLDKEQILNVDVLRKVTTTFKIPMTLLVAF